MSEKNEIANDMAQLDNSLQKISLQFSKLRYRIAETRPAEAHQGELSVCGMLTTRLNALESVVRNREGKDHEAMAVRDGEAEALSSRVNDLEAARHDELNRINRLEAWNPLAMTIRIEQLESQDLKEHEAMAVRDGKADALSVRVNDLDNEVREGRAEGIWGSVKNMRDRIQRLESIQRHGGDGADD